MTTYEFKFKDGRLFTGYVDKNGNEIHDGDRVEASDAWLEIKAEKGSVQYIPDRALFAVYFDTPDLTGKSVGENGENWNWEGFGDLDEIALLT